MKTLFLSIALMSVLCSTNPVQSFFPYVQQVDSATVTFKFIAPDHRPDSLSRNYETTQWLKDNNIDTFLIYFGCQGHYKVIDSLKIDSIPKNLNINNGSSKTISLPIGTYIHFSWDVTVYFFNKLGVLDMFRVRHDYFYTLEKDDYVVIDGRY